MLLSRSVTDPPNAWSSFSVVLPANCSTTSAVQQYKGAITRITSTAADPARRCELSSVQPAQRRCRRTSCHPDSRLPPVQHNRVYAPEREKERGREGG